MTSSAEAASTTRVSVAAAVIASNPNDVTRALSSRAVAGAAGSYVVGGGDAAQEVAVGAGVPWVGSVPDLVDALGPEITHIWLLHDDTTPRPDALSALVAETERLDASMVGSKILDAAHPEMLLSVGGATDVYGVPDTALVVDEMDQEQYDVVRDVAYVPGESILVRRDLMRGLGGPDMDLPPVVRAIDFAQRARLAGGRVAVVPSSEVLHARSCELKAPEWRRVAGQWRAQIKVYGALTLAWLVPFFLVIAVVDATARTLMGRPLALLDLARAILWNVKHLPGTIAARRRARAVRQVGDEEMFRYQLRGSVAMRRLASDLTDWFRARDEGVVGSFLDRRRGFWQESGFATGLGALVAVVVAGRSLWFDRLPVTGFALTMPDPAFDTLANYAGGLNPAGFGSPQPMHPSVAATALVQLIVGDDGRRALWVITLGALIAGYSGVRRLLTGMGIDGIPAAVGGAVVVLGPAVAGATGVGFWPVLPAVAGVAWVLAGALTPWPAGWRSRLGRVGVTVLAGGVAASYVPLSVLVPLVVAVLWSLFGVRSYRSVMLAAIGGLGGIATIGPWLWWVSIATIARAGDPLFWDVEWWVAAAGGAVLVGGALVGSSRSVALVGTGGLLAIAGGWLARSAQLGSGHEPTAVGFVAAAIGGGLIVAAALDMMRDIEGSNLVRSGLVRFVQFSAIVVAVPAVLTVLSGSAGLGDDRFDASLEFTKARAASHGPDRVLLIGEGLPGQSRSVDGTAYRVVSGGEVRLAEAWLAPPSAADRALDDLLAGLGEEAILRPGAELAGFGVRWVVLTSRTPLSSAFEATLDLKRLPLIDNPFTVYENLEPSPRAVTTSGEAWTWTGFGYEGPPAGEVRFAEAGHERWGGTTDGWSAIVDGSSGSVAYAVEPTIRLLGWLAVATMAAALLAVAASLGARR